MSMTYAKRSAWPPGQAPHAGQIPDRLGTTLRMLRAGPSEASAPGAFTRCAVARRSCASHTLQALSAHGRYRTRRPSSQPTGANQLYRVTACADNPALARTALTALCLPEQPALSAGYGLSNGGCPSAHSCIKTERGVSVSVGRGFTKGQAPSRI